MGKHKVSTPSYSIRTAGQYWKHSSGTIISTWALLSIPTIPIRHARPPPLPPRFSGDDNLPHHHEHSPANLSPLMQYTPRLHNRLRVLTTTTLLSLHPPEPDISTFNLRSNTPLAAVTTRSSTTAAAAAAAADPRHESPE